jgi:hypothetical protein
MKFVFPISSAGSAWASHEYENQKNGGQLFSYDLEYQLPPSLPADLNLTIVRGQAFTYQIKSKPPAFVYTLSGGTLPTGVSLNAATGILEGNTTDAVSSISLSLAAMNGKGTATVNLNLSIRDGLTAPVVSSGEVLEVFGRGARIRGLLSDAGGASNEVSIHYGLADAGTNTNDWNHSLYWGSKIRVHLRLISTVWIVAKSIFIVLKRVTDRLLGQMPAASLPYFLIREF